MLDTDRELTQVAQQKLADTVKEKEAYDKALNKLKEVSKELQITLQSEQPLPEFSAAIMRLSSLSTDCDFLIHRIRTNGW